MGKKKTCKECRFFDKGCKNRTAFGKIVNENSPACKKYKPKSLTK